MHSHVKTSLTKKKKKPNPETEKPQHTNKTPTSLLPALDILCKVGESGKRDHFKKYSLYYLCT